jgi:hypothetical protein
MQFIFSVEKPDDAIYARDHYLGLLQLIAVAAAFLVGIVLQLGLTVIPPAALAVFTASALATSAYFMYRFYLQNRSMFEHFSAQQKSTMNAQDFNVLPNILLGSGMMAFAVLLASGFIFTPILGTVSTIVVFSMGLTQVLKTGLRHYANQLAYASDPNTPWHERIRLHYDAQHTLSMGSATSAIFALALSILASGLIGIPIIIPIPILIAGAAFSALTFSMSVIAIYRQEQQLSRLIQAADDSKSDVFLEQIQNRQASRIALSTTGLVIIAGGVMALPVAIPLTVLAIIGGAAVVAIIGNIISWSATQKKLLTVSSTPDLLALEQQEITLQNVKTTAAVVSGLLMIVAIFGIAMPILPMASMLVSGAIGLLAYSAVQIANHLSKRNQEKISAIKNPETTVESQSNMSIVEIAKQSALLVTGIIMLLMIPNLAIGFLSPAAMIGIATISFVSFATVNIINEVRDYMSKKDQKDAPIDTLNIIKNIALITSASIMLISLPSMAIGFLPAPAMLTFSIVSFIAYAALSLIGEYKARSSSTSTSPTTKPLQVQAGLQHPTTAQHISHTDNKTPHSHTDNKTPLRTPINYGSRPLPAIPTNQKPSKQSNP